MAQQTQGIALGALTRTTPFVQSRSFNKCQKLQRSVCFSLVEGKFKCYDLTSLHSAVSENVPQKLPCRWNNFLEGLATNCQIKNFVYKDRLRMGVSCLKWFILLHNLLLLHTLHTLHIIYILHILHIFCIFCLVCIVCIVCIICINCTVCIVCIFRSVHSIFNKFVTQWVSKSVSHWHA